MNIISRLHGKSGNFIGRLLTTGVSVWLLGVAFTPALAATQSPAIEQAPLIIQKPLPPNIVLMLDDSGSMAWDYMPDWGYLKNNTDNDALIDANNNGVYYNPTVVYTPPVKADGTRYPDATGLTSAWVDGFDQSAGSKDLTAYSSGQGANNIDYSTGSAQYYKDRVWGEDDCEDAYDSMDGYDGYTYSRWSNVCQFTYHTSAAKYFQYSTGDANGSYVVHYVAATDCGTQTNCVKASDTTGVAAPNKDARGEALLAQDGTSLTAGQNIANWFAYYHTRMLMAKSGVMNAFSTIDPTFRVGFGSINGNNDEGLPALNDKYGSNDNYIAQVMPFGDGASGTQKASFWSWVDGGEPKNGTPLRRSLDAVGQYYKSDQPWQTSSTDDNELACRQSYTILTTDGFWNGSTPDNIGNQDNIEAGPITRPDNLPTVTYNPAPPYLGTDSDTLADVAMKYWVTDLRPASNEVPTSKEDSAYWQHMVTFTLGMGFDPKDADGTEIPMDKVFDWALAPGDSSSKAIADFSWPAPDGDSINNIADLAHAAVNGHGGFASAKTPDEFSNALKKALQRASDRVGTGASLAANSTQLKTGAFAYQANYFTGDWKGDLKAIAVDPNNGTLATTPTWTASSELPAAADRKIYTYNPDTAAAVEFKTVAALSADEKTALGSDATAQLDMINYLRGDHSKEIGQTDGTYRARETPLGDIVDSQPVYSGQPDANQFVGQSFTGKDSYEAHAAKTRSGLIFVAANDGMLHAFYTDTVTADGTVAGSSSVADTSSVAGASSVAVVDTIAGAEAYAYLPAAVITTNTSTTTPARSTSDLTTLADSDYGTTTSVPHQFFNDGELTVADAYFGSAWHTVAVGTTGRGLAKAIYALDVTDPTSISLLWERSAGDGKANADYIGQMIGKPVIAQTTDAGTSDPTGDSNWSVLIGNGYNSTKGTAALLQFNLADGTLSVHKTDDAITGNGLAAPAVWIGDLSVGISTVAFAGDLKGNVWSFSLNTAKTVKVKGEDVTTYTANLTSTGTTLFIAKDSAGTVQPITAGMLVGKNPVTQDLWVFFGTGQYLGNSDLTTTATQSWYGLIVQAGTGSDSTAVTSATTRTSTTTKLKQRSIIAETKGTDAVLNDDDGTIETAAIAPARAVTELPTTSDMDGMSGWYIDLLAPTSSTSTEQDPDFPDDPTKTIEVTTYTPNAVAQGERIVTPSQFQGNQLLATTRIPEAVDLCNPSGRGWIMAVDPFTGTNPKSSFFDLNGDGQINQPADYIMVNGKPVATSGIGFSSLPNNPIFMGGTMLVSFDNGSAASIKTSGTSNTLQRVSWRELIAQ